MTPPTFRDGRELAICTCSPDAARRYAEGVELLIASSPGAESAFRDAVAADAQFALAWMALAIALAPLDAGTECGQCAAQARSSVRGASRRERQHIEVLSALFNGDRRRAAVLGREHLREFPADVVVAHVLESGMIDASDEAGDDRLGL